MLQKAPEQRLVSVTLRDQVTVEVGADAVGVGHDGPAEAFSICHSNHKNVFRLFFSLKGRSGAPLVLTKQFCHELTVT